MSLFKFNIAMFVYFIYIFVLALFAATFSGTEYEGIATLVGYVSLIAVLVPVWMYLHDSYRVHKSFNKAIVRYERGIYWINRIGA